MNVHIKGYEAQKKLETQQSNISAWLICAYVKLAIVSAFESSCEYPEMPFGMERNIEKELEPWQLQKMKMANFATKVQNKQEKHCI